MKHARINGIADIESVDQGETIRLHIAMDDGSVQILDIDHDRAPKLVSDIALAMSIAARDRPTLTPSGNPMPQRVKFAGYEGIGAYSYEGHVVVRILLKEGSSLAPPIQVDYLVDSSAAAQLGQDLIQLSQDPGSTPTAQH